MKRYGDLFEKVVDIQNLYLAAHKAFRGTKFKYTTASFYFHFENEILKMQKQLIDETYYPAVYRIFKIYEPKERKICCAEFYDRVVHHAIINILEPLFERRLIHETYACRVGKGTYNALKKSQAAVRKYKYYLKCDIKKYFESIDHVFLKSLLRKMIKDKKLLRLLDKIISHQPSYTPLGKGLPIGNLTSQHFANVYLGELDLFVKHQLKCQEYIRYMDDFILFSHDKEELKDYLEKMRFYLLNELKLNLKEKVVKIAPVSEGLPFLGYRVFRGLIRLQRANLVRFRRKVKRKEKSFLKGKITQEDLTNSMMSLITHISYGNTRNLRNTVFFK